MIYQLEDRRVVAEGEHFIADSARVIGSIRLGNNVGIWFGAVLRGDNEPIVIGENSNVQEGCVLHTDMGSPLIIGDYCTIGHKAVVHGCTIGNNTLLGINSVILNDARIGNNCLIGAGALVTEGREIPDNSLVLGSPGRVVRELTPEQIDDLTVQAERYVRNIRRYNRGLSVQSQVEQL